LHKNAYNKEYVQWNENGNKSKVEDLKMKKITKKLIVLALALVMLFSLAACGGSDAYIVAMEPTFPPFDTTDENGELDGFDVDLMNAIAEDQGFQIEWTQLGFDGLIPALESKQIDIIASGMWASPERAKIVDFSTTYYDSGLVLAVKVDNNIITGADSLTSDMKVAAQIGTSSADLVQQWEKDGKIAEAKIYDKVNEAVMDLQNGTVDALLNDKPVTTEYMSKQPDKIKIVGDILNEESYGFAVNKENKDLLDMINAGLQNVIDNGTYDQLLAKWGL
jgi:ABC-type amino acid transport substrate-binding protein